MQYVYLIEDIETGTHRYVGITTDLRQRLAEHNAGKSAHTAKFRPWQLVAYLGFTDPVKAADFEKYLKSGSGHAFARKHFWRSSRV